MAITRASTDFEGDQVNGGSGSASLSADGTLVAFGSGATNLGILTGVGGIFVKNLNSGEIVRASSTTFGTAFTAVNTFDPSLAADGSAVAFATNSQEIVKDPGKIQIVVKEPDDRRCLDWDCPVFDTAGERGGSAWDGGRFQIEARNAP